MTLHDAEKPSLTAVHEAGHAVVGRVLGIPCGEVSIVPSEPEREEGLYVEAEGHANVGDADDLHQRMQDRCWPIGRLPPLNAARVGYALSIMAGFEATDVILGEHIDGEDGDDRERIATVFEEAAADGEPIPFPETRLRSGARRMIRRHQEAIIAVARLLDTRKTLDGPTVDKVVEVELLNSRVTSR